MTSSHNVPSRSRKHFHLVFGIPRPLPHCPPSSNTAPDEPSPQGEQKRWLSWFGVLRIGPENLDVHKTRLFPATLNYAPPEFQALIANAGISNSRQTWIQAPCCKTHLDAFRLWNSKNYKIWSVFRQTQRSKHGPFSWAKWVSDSFWWHKERANDKQTNTASLLLRHTIGYFLLLQPNSKWLQTSPNPQRQWHILMWTAGHRR